MIQLEADEETKDALRRQNKVLNTKNLSLESQVERLCAVRDNIDAVNGRLNTSFKNKHKNVSFVDDEVQEEIIGTDQFLIKTKINEFKSTITNLQAEKDRLKVNLEQRSREKTDLEEKLEDRQHELDRKEAAVDRLQIKLTAEVHKREGAGAASEELDKIKK
jgi:chromosome segregation ATPase